MFWTSWRSFFVRRRLGFKRFCLKKRVSLPVFCAQASGLKRFQTLEMLLLCTGAWVLRGFCMLRCYFCAQARAFQDVFVCRDATFVHRRLGFERLLYAAMLLLCTGAWVLRGFCMLRACLWSKQVPEYCQHFSAFWLAKQFMCVCVCLRAFWRSTFVCRRMGFKHFCQKI